MKWKEIHEMYGCTKIARQIKNNDKCRYFETVFLLCHKMLKLGTFFG